MEQRLKADEATEKERRRAYEAAKAKLEVELSMLKDANWASQAATHNVLATARRIIDKKMKTNNKKAMKKIMANINNEKKKEAYFCVAAGASAAVAPPSSP